MLFEKHNNDSLDIKDNLHNQSENNSHHDPSSSFLFKFNNRNWDDNPTTNGIPLQTDDAVTHETNHEQFVVPFNGLSNVNNNPKNSELEIPSEIHSTAGDLTPTPKDILIPDIFVNPPPESKEINNNPIKHFKSIISTQNSPIQNSPSNAALDSQSEFIALDNGTNPTVFDSQSVASPINSLENSISNDNPTFLSMNIDTEIPYSISNQLHQGQNGTHLPPATEQPRNQNHVLPHNPSPSFDFSHTSEPSTTHHTHSYVNSVEPNSHQVYSNPNRSTTLMRPLSSGSQTILEMPQSINSPNSHSYSASNGSFSVPILRLSVDPLTLAVKYDSKYDKEGIKSSPNSQISTHQNARLTLDPPLNKNNFIMKRSEPTVIINHCEDYIEEINDSQTSGSTGGEKRDINGNWKETWLQQKKYTEDENGNLQEHTFGEKSGHDIARHQRWTERWNNRGPQIEVERNVLRYDDDNHLVLEEWNETLTRNELDDFVMIDKNGIDRSDEVPRNWKTKYQHKRTSDKNSVLVIEELFQEQKGSVEKGKIYRKENGVISHTKEWYSDNTENGESWTDETFSNSTGFKWGQKSGYKNNGQKWGEKWFNNDDGDCETDRWVQEPSGDSFSGEKSGFCAQNGEAYNEKWKKSDTKIEKYQFSDKWWTRENEKRKWGIKTEVEEHFKPTDGTSDLQLSSRESFTENWNENEQEFTKNESRVSTEYKILQNGHTETFETRKFTKGNRHGHHYSSSQEWNDEWSELYECDTDPIEEKKPVLKLKLKSYEKWWKENNSNCWGEKRSDDFSTGKLREEKWYFNPSGWQVDKWEKCSDGTWIGEKHGSKNDGTSWNEAWKRDDNLGNEWIEKSWNEPKQDKIYKWGETTEKNDITRSTSRWSETKNVQNSEGDFKTEKFNDDGFGNIKTEKEGKSWVNDGRTHKIVNWYFDSYGENLGRSEKWAFKKGYNEGGSEWIEKWNEMPSQKYSKKAGKNAIGDEWNETWKEVIEESQPVLKWAEKQGKNSNGDEWMETWIEEHNKKGALKKGSNRNGEKWEERWGEDIRADGSGEKWTSKWAKESNGIIHGNSWGDRWGPNENKFGHHWGEEWTNDDIRKWWYDTSGRPEGC